MNEPGRDIDEASSAVLRVQQTLANFPLADTSAPFYTVGQVAQLLEVQPAFLRRLDSEAVVSPRRSDGRQRRYSYDDITTIQRTVELIGEGMTLAGIRRVMLLEQEVALLRAELVRKRSRSKKNHESS